MKLAYPYTNKFNFFHDNMMPSKSDVSKVYIFKAFKEFN